MSAKHLQICAALAIISTASIATAKPPPAAANEPLPPAPIARLCAALPDPAGDKLRPLKAYIQRGNRKSVYICMAGKGERRWSVYVNHVAERLAGGAATAGDASRRCDPTRPEEANWGVCNAKRFVSVNRNVEVCLAEPVTGQPDRVVCPTPIVKLGTHAMVHVRWNKAPTGPAEFGSYLIPLAMAPTN